MNDGISNFDDLWRPIKAYFYWESHSFDIPMCWAFRSLFDALDNIDKLADQTFDDMVNVGLDSTSPAAMTSSTSPEKVSTTKTSRPV
jgi:RND superfamily putative drug exporter